MRNIITIISLIGLSACNGEFKTFSQAITKADCPSPKVVYLQNNKNDSTERFNFHIYNIESNQDNIKFQSLNYDFVFCRANSSWTVQPGTIKTELLPARNYTELSKELVNPGYKSINFQGKTYKYRVVLEPGFVLGKDNLLSRPTVEAEKDRVVFELLVPNSKPVRQTLYTLKDLQQKAVKSGFSSDSVKVGFPRISASLIHDNSLWWAIAFEQAEGNTGIATIVSYQPQVGMTVIQPDQLGSQQISDLVITGDQNNPTFWIGTKNSSEGNEYLPANGLVAYRPDLQNPNSGVLRSYNVDNSPLVGAIPDKLKLDGDIWVATGNGVCQINWQAADTDWTCWRFAAMAKLPASGVPLYQALTNKTPAVKLTDSSGGDVEVLWWSAVDWQSQGRYEVRYPQGFTIKLNQSASLKKSQQLPPGKPPVDWVGFEWHWQGDRFVRGLDQVASNYSGGGVQGIGSNREALRQTNWNTIRGDLELIEISPTFTDLKYYSGWVDQKLLHPYLTVVPEQRPINPQPNPLETVVKQLQPSSSYNEG